MAKTRTRYRVVNTATGEEVCRDLSKTRAEKERARLDAEEAAAARADKAADRASVYERGEPRAAIEPATHTVEPYETEEA